MDIELPFDFKEILRLLNENGGRYLLIGGYAVGYYGYPFATNDMNVWIAIHPDNAQRVVHAKVSTFSRGARTIVTWRPSPVSQQKWMVQNALTRPRIPAPNLKNRSKKDGKP
jgi:hypothetical protein